MITGIGIPTSQSKMPFIPKPPLSARFARAGSRHLDAGGKRGETVIVPS